MPKAHSDIGLSKTYSPCTIMTGKALDWNKRCKLHFRAYVQVHEDALDQHTIGEDTRINMPKAHRQPRWHLYLFSLRSGKKITLGQLAEVPIPMIAMKRVAEMTLTERQNKELIFENCTGATVNDILPDDKVNESFNKIYRNITGVDWET